MEKSPKMAKIAQKSRFLKFKIVIWTCNRSKNFFTQFKPPKIAQKPMKLPKNTYFSDFDQKSQNRTP